MSKPQRPALPLSRLQPSDLFGEALSAIVAKPARAAITTIGTVLGVGTLVAVLGLTATIQGQVGSRFDALTAKTVTVEDARTDNAQSSFPFSSESEARVARLNGVTAVGYSWAIQEDRAPVDAQSADGPTAIGAYAMSAGQWEIESPHLVEGRLFDRFHESASANVVVLGRAAAKTLGITTLVNQPAITIAGQPYSVIGIVDSMRIHPDMLLGAIIPSSTAIAHWGAPDQKSLAAMTIETEIGAARQIASEASLAIDPTEVSSVKSIPPPDPRNLRDAVSTDLAGLFLALAALCLLVGAVGIANTTLVAVLERTAEIGLRRAVGARRRHVGLQIVTESAALGILGGLVGSSLGILVIFVVAIAQRWGPVLDPTVVLVAPLVGILTGMLAGLYPAWRATRIEPADALRSS